MAEIRPLTALHYAADVPLDDVVAPPYDVIDDEQRAHLLARSPHNVVEIDLPQADGDPYEHAAAVFAQWQQQGVVVRDDEPALWLLTQDYTGPDGQPRTRRGFFAKVKVEEYGPGKIRPHERTHPGPKEDRLRLTRATKANLSPIFSLYSDPEQRAFTALDGAKGEPFGTTTDEDGTQNTLWRVTDADAIATAVEQLGQAELLIADGHHRYETARVYAQEQLETEEAGWVLMCLVALEDPGLTIFPTHRLVKGRGLQRYEELTNELKADFSVEDTTGEELAPPPSDGPMVMGYLDSHFKKPLRLTMTRDEPVPDLEGPLARLDTAILESLLLKGVLGLTDDDIDHLNDFGYARDAKQAIELVTSGAFDVAFLLRPPPVAQVREIAAAGQNMPPKSTYFFPKVPTGLLFNPVG